ncbi:MAG: dienelactone hydrolase family protein [Candidatus Hodarchaeales archaeon]
MLQSNFGTIDIEIVRIADENGDIAEGKLYRPTYATSSNPLPGVLLLHGFNNDKDTEAPAALELARRGFVALALSEIGHGDSSPASGLLATFGEGTLGANAAYLFLKGLSFVDGDNLGLVGHSMGGSNAIKVAAANPDHRAIVIQHGSPTNVTASGELHNYLQLWCRYEDLNPLPRATYIANGMTMIEYNTNETAEADKIYGSHVAGTAQKYAFIESTHPGGTWNGEGVAETCEWMRLSLKGGTTDSHWINPYNQIYLFKEGLTLVATITAILSIIPLASILLKTSVFNKVVQPLPDRHVNEGRSWWIGATANTLIGGITFIFLPGIGMMIGIILPIFNLITGNAFMLWFVANAVICGIVFAVWFRRNKDVNWFDVGISFDKDQRKLDKNIIWKTLLLAGFLFIYLYLIVSLFENLFLVEFRFMWPVLRQFSGYRFTQFLIYLLPIMSFFFINGGLFLYGQIRPKQHETFAKTHLIWWGRSFFAMVFGLFLMFCIHYLPLFFLGAGPTFTEFYASLFFIFLMQGLPQFTLIFFVTTYFYQKTGKIYLGSILAGLLVTWIFAISGAYTMA